ncbi:MAG: AsmA family protein [Gemmatimonadota bacterium]
MNRIPRWLIVVLAVLVMLPLAGAAALKAMFPPERLRELAEPQLEARLGRDVSLGAVKLKVFPYIAIRLQDLAVENPPGFSPAAMVQLDALDLRLELWPLLRREYELSQVRLIGPILRYEVAVDGTNNLAGILADAEAAASDADAGSASRFDVEDLVFVDGGVLYRNAETGRAMRARVEGNLSVTAGERAGGTMAADGELRLTEALMVVRGADSTALPDVEMDYRALFDPSDGRLAIPEVRIHAAGLSLEGSGASQVADAVRSIRIDLASAEFRVSDLIEQLPQRRERPTFDADARATLAIRWAGVLGGSDGEAPALTGTATYSELTIATADRGQLVSGGSGTVSFTSQMLDAPDISGRLLGRPFQARARIDDFADPSIDGRLSGEFDLEQLQELGRAEPMPVTGSAALDIGFRGPARDTESWDVSGPIRLTNVSYASPRLPAPAEIADATIRLSGGGMQADGVPIRVGESDATLSFSSPQFVRYLLSDPAERGAAPPIQFTASSDRLAATDLRREEPAVGYSDLVKARLTGRRVGGQDPQEIARARYRLPELTDYRASGTMSIADWVNPPTSAREVSFRVELADGVLDITQVAGTVYGGRLAGGLRLDLDTSENPHEVEYDLQLTTARAGDLLERWTTIGRRLDGTVNFDITGSSPLDDGFLPMPAGFAAAGSASFVEGRFQDLGITDVVKQRFNLAPDKLSQFKDLGGPFEIRDGQFVVRNWSFGAGDITGVISGSAGLGGVLDLDLAAMLPVEAIRSAGLVDGNPALEALLDQLSDGGDHVPVKLDVGGTMESPALQVDGDALAATLREQVQNQGRDQFQDAARGLLEGLLNPTQEEPVEQPDPTEADAP